MDIKIYLHGKCANKKNITESYRKESQIQKKNAFEMEKKKRKRRGNMRKGMGMKEA